MVPVPIKQIELLVEGIEHTKVVEEKWQETKPGEPSKVEF